MRLGADFASLNAVEFSSVGALEGARTKRCSATAKVARGADQRVTTGLLEQRKMTDLDLIKWTIEEAARVKSERGEAGHLERRRPLDKLLAELEREPVAKSATPPDLGGLVGFADPELNGIRHEVRAAREGSPAPIEGPAEVGPALDELAASIDRFAALERRYAAHLAESTSAPTMPAAADVAPKPALLRAIVEPDILTARADRERAVDLRWILRDIRNRRSKNSPEIQNDLRVLIEFGLVELQQDEPVLTNAGLDAIR